MTAEEMKELANWVWLESGKLPCDRRWDLVCEALVELSSVITLLEDFDNCRDLARTKFNSEIPRKLQAILLDEEALRRELAEGLAVAREARDLADVRAKAEVQREMAELRKRLAKRDRTPED